MSGVRIYMSEITISQGLRRVKKLKGQLAEFQLRAQSSVTYKASEQPAFSLRALLETSSEVRNELISLESMIALANA